MGRVGQRGGRTGAVPLWQQLLAMPGRCPRPPLGASTSPLPRLVWPPGLDPFLKAPGPVFFPLFSVSLPPAAGQALGSPPPRCPSLPTSLAWPRGISLEHPPPSAGWPAHTGICVYGCLASTYTLRLHAPQGQPVLQGAPSASPGWPEPALELPGPLCGPRGPEGQGLWAMAR